MNKPFVLMMCGTSGSGKTRLSKLLEQQGFPRLSIDCELWPDFYVFSDLLSDEHKAFLKQQAMERIKARCRNFLAEGRGVSVDMCFCHRAQREEFKAFVREAGGVPVLIFLKASPAVLKTRLAEREGKNGPDDLPVSEAELLRFLKNFQVPSGEGEIVINSEQEFDLDEILKEISKKAEG